MGLWYDEVWEDQVKLGLRATETLFSEQSSFQKVEIINTVAYGRVLIIDDVFMTSERDEFIYHEMITHPAMLTAASQERVLIIGGGDGGTAREVLRHPGASEVVMIELDETVVRGCQAHLRSIGSAWEDPRLDVRFADGIDYVKNSDEEKYDVILLDGTDPIGPGEVLFGLPFFEGCKRMLKPEGVLAMQSETPMLLRDIFFETQEKLRGLWKHVHPYFAGVPLYPSGSWSWTWCSDRPGHLDFDAPRAAKIEEGNRYYTTDIHVGAFAQPAYVKQGLKALDK